VKPTMGSLFAGIGGFDLGFERAGFDVAWQVEIDPWCHKVLAKNFPNAERFEDVREVGKHNLKHVDVLCGGFPCQDISNAGLRAGIEGKRSGLWSEYVRIVGELRPKFVLVENVAALLGRGLSRVVGDLAEIGYDAEWEVVSAADVGAPHLRERVWIMAYPKSERCAKDREFRRRESPQWASRSREEVADTWMHWTCGWEREPQEALRYARKGGRQEAWMSIPESLLGRVADGVPDIVDRLRGLGNAVVPQIPELYARRIKQLLIHPAS
jgi:DNA (cytosine-5)-methyltransferase 1